MKNQPFGIEIETTGIGRERTAKAIAAYFGTTAQYRGHHLDDWRVPMPDGRHWTVESDGSVTDPDAEVVSPVCRYEDIGMVQEVVRAIRAAGAKADGSCGIHIHIGLGEHTPQGSCNAGRCSAAAGRICSTDRNVVAPRSSRGRLAGLPNSPARSLRPLSWPVHSWPAQCRAALPYCHRRPRPCRAIQGSKASRRMRRNSWRRYAGCIGFAWSSLQMKFNFIFFLQGY